MRATTVFLLALACGSASALTTTDQVINISVVPGATLTSALNSVSSGSVPAVAPPSSPLPGQLWNSSSLAKLQASASPYERYPIGFNGQEPSVWIYGGNYNMAWTVTGGYFAEPTASPIVFSQCPTTAPCAGTGSSAVFYGTVSGTTLTVSQPSVSSGPSRALPPPIAVGMTLQTGTGAVIQAFGTAGTTGLGGVGTYSLSGSPGTVTNPTLLSANYWSMPVAIIGSGAGGWTPSAGHGHVKVFGSTLYYYGVAEGTAGGYTNQNIYGCSAPIATPTVWTCSNTVLLPPVGGASSGNINVILYGGTYYMFAEGLFTVVDPYQGTTNPYLVMVATSSAPLTAYTSVVAPLQTLRPTPVGSTSDVQIIQEGANCVAYFHASSWDRAMPTQLYRAQMPCANLGTDGWTILGNGAPFATLAHPYEYDQVADGQPVTLSSGTTYMFYEGFNNVTNKSALMTMVLAPTPYQYDGQQWQLASLVGFNTAQQGSQTGFTTWSWSPGLNNLCTTYGAWTPTASSTSANGGYLVSDGNQNDYVQCAIGGLSPGLYQVALTYQTNSNGGVATVVLSDDAFTIYSSVVNGTNLLSYSNLLTNAAWTKLNVSAAATAVTPAPDGTNTANLITSTATGADRAVQFYSQAKGGLTYTAQAVMKAGTVNGYIAFLNASVNAYVTCNLSTGAAVVSGTGATGTCTSLGSVGGGGWYKLTLTQTLPGSGTLTLYEVVGPQDGSGTSAGYPANGTAGGTVYVANAQMEQNSSASAYQPVTSLTADTYSASLADNVTWTTGMQIFGTETFEKQLKLSMATKNGSSSAYGLSLSKITLTRQAPQ